MRFGLSAFCTADSLDPGSVAVAAEQAGFELLLFPDHTHIPVSRQSPYPGGGELPGQYMRTYDPLVAAAFAASATRSLPIGVGVCLVTARDPIVLAKQVASIDVLAGGRSAHGADRHAARAGKGGPSRPHAALRATGSHARRDRDAQ